jgi:hypothetical protein
MMGPPSRGVLLAMHMKTTREAYHVAAEDYAVYMKGLGQHAAEQSKTEHEDAFFLRIRAAVAMRQYVNAINAYDAEHSLREM